MKKKICLIILLTINFIINAQKKESDYFTFYKGGGKYLKPLKYVLFIPKEGNVKTEEGRKEIEGAIVELIDFAYSKKK